MKRAPTLADGVHQTMIGKYGKGLFMPGFRDAFTRARRFVLDESMSAFLADITWQGLFVGAKPLPDIPIAAWHASRGALAAKNMDAMRRLARVPHPVSWIEWDEIALAKRASSVYGSEMDPERVPFRTGFLLVRHPTIETAARAIGFGEGANLDTNLIGGLRDPDNREIGLSPFGFGWTSADDMPIPWATVPPALDLAEKRRTPVGSMATGVSTYASDKISFVGVPDLINPKLYERSSAAELRAQLQEHFGMARYILALLATLNDLPVRFTEVKPSKGYVARGNYRRYLDHHTVTLTVPVTRYKALARRALTIARRRAHEVRGHWRDDWKHPGVSTCEHNFTATENRLQCACGKRRMWIPEHMRGDATLGFVNHDYVVKKEQEDAQH